MKVLRTVLLASSLLAVGSPLLATKVAEVLRTGHATVTGGRIYYEATGFGSHVVFLSGGNWMDLREWDGQFQRLSAKFQTIRFDARGSGLSSAVVAPFSPVEDLHALLDALQLKQVHLVGSSRAAGVALDYAIAHPERVLSLCLVNPVVSGWQPSEKYAKRQAGLLSVLKKSGAKAFAKAALADPHQVPSGGRGKTSDLLRANAAKVLAYDPAAEIVPDPPALRRLADVRAPTLLIVGEQDDPELLQLGNSLAAGIRGVKKMVMFGTGHSVNLENPRKLAKALREFLEGLPAR